MHFAITNSTNYKLLHRAESQRQRYQDVEHDQDQSRSFLLKRGNVARSTGDSRSQIDFVSQVEPPPFLKRVPTMDDLGLPLAAPVQTRLGRDQQAQRMNKAQLNGRGVEIESHAVERFGFFASVPSRRRYLPIASASASLPVPVNR